MKNRRIFKGLWIFALTVLCLFMSLSASAATKKISLSKTSLTMVQGQKSTLKLKYIPKNSKVTWASSNKKVVKVSSKGQITAVSKGKCTITAKYNKKIYKCRVTVKAIAISNTYSKMVVGRTLYLSLNNANGTVSWKSSDPSVAKVNGKGMVTAVGAGFCEISAVYNGITKTCGVDVVNTTLGNLMESYSINKENSGRIVLAGSSTLDYWTGAGDAFAPYKIINTAIGGTWVTQWLQWYSHLICAYNPSAVVFYAGANDLNGGISDQSNAANTIKLLNRLKNAMPSTPIFYVSVVATPSGKVQNQIAASNKLVKQYCDQTAFVTYIDLYSSFLKNGVPNKDLFLTDLLHPNEAGYSIWKSKVVTAVRKAIK